MFDKMTAISWIDEGVKMGSLVSFVSLLKLIFFVSFSLLISSQISEGKYVTYHLEDRNVCGTTSSETAAIYVDANDAIILHFGDRNDTESINSAARIHRCEVKFSTRREMQLSVTLEQLDFRGNRDPKTNGWECDDYIKMSTVGTGIINKLLEIIPHDAFRAKVSDRLCGQRQLLPDSVGYVKLVELSTSSANVFSSMSNKLGIEIHQDTKEHTSGWSNSFTLIITPFFVPKNSDVCHGYFTCQSSNNKYCINKEFECDSRVNCGFPASGSDERDCQDGIAGTRITRLLPGTSNAMGDVYASPILSTTATILVVLGSLIGAAALLFVIYTFFMRSSPRNSERSPHNSDQFSDFVAMPVSRHGTLPLYEAAVLAAPPPPKEDLPPPYEMLFPDGYLPKDIKETPGIPPEEPGIPPTADSTKAS